MWYQVGQVRIWLCTLNRLATPQLLAAANTAGDQFGKTL